MWGDGSAKPDESAFRRQFEPDGGGYLYRRNLEGRGVRVNPEEYERLIDQHERGIFKIIFLCVIVYLLSTIVFAIAEIEIYGDDLSGISGGLSFFTTAAYGFWRWKKNRQRLDKELAGRDKVGLDRSVRDARALRMALSGWRSILCCAGFIVVMCVAQAQNGDLPALRDWIWWGPLSVIVVAGLVWWSVRKAQAIRACRQRE